MFKQDLSYSNKQKAIRFTEDSKNFLVSLNDALGVLREKAFLENQKAQYVQSSTLLLNHFDNQRIVFLPNNNNDFKNHKIDIIREDKKVMEIANYCTQFVNNLGLNNQINFSSLSLKLD